MARFDFKIMMAIFANVLPFLAVIISKYGYHAFDVSIQTFNSLPVIGEDFTLVCTFTPQSGYRRLIWAKSNNIVVASHSCLPYRDCTWVTFPDASKFSFMADTSSGNLTLKQLDTNDSDNYQCTVTSTYGMENPGSNSLQVTPLPPAPPFRIRITDERSIGYYQNNVNITVTAGEPHDITCTADGARPPAVLIWRIPDDVKVLLQNQSNAIQGNSYVSRKAATITPSTSDQGKNLCCVASHPELQSNSQSSVYLKVQVQPSSIFLFESGDNTERQSGSTVIYVQEGLSTSITCKSIGSLPAVELSLNLLVDNNSISGSSNHSKYRNALDGTLFDTESTIAIHPERKHHGIFIQCYVSLDGNFIHVLLAKLIVYGPPDNVKVTTPDDLRDGVETNLNCRAINGYPAPLIHWYIGSTNVTHDSSFKTSMNEADRYDAESTLTIIPKRLYHRKPLLCQAVQTTTPSMRSVNDSMVLNISYDPVVFISSRRLTSNKLRTGFVLTCTSDANPPAFIFQWLCNGIHFSNDTHIIKLSKNILEGETLTFSEVVIQNPLSQDPCEYECVAVSRYGFGSAVYNSTFSLLPDPPSGVFVNPNKTTSLTLFVAWEPGFNGGLEQTFTLQYCLNDTQEEGCDVVPNLAGTSHTLVGLVPFTWYQMTLWAVNSAGNSSAVEPVVASTTPLQPESYGVTTRWDKQKHILTLSEANQTLDEICFITLRNYSGPDCASVNGTECVEPGTEITIDPDGDTVLVTYGRGLCSKPDDLKDSPVENEPSSKSDIPYMTIAIGVIASAGFILLISLGLMYFYGVLCCVKLKKDNGDNAQEGRTVDDDGLVYMSVSHDRVHPPNAPPIQTEEPTVYASLNPDVTQRRKGEMKYADTKATTPDGQPMYGNYLVKKRKQEQARMPPPIQTDDASYHTEGMEFRKGGMKGAMGPTTPDGQPMYGNYLVKMRKDEERAKQMAGTHDVFEMYGI